VPIVVGVASPCCEREGVGSRIIMPEATGLPFDADRKVPPYPFGGHVVTF
jgi:hypothetical protein